MQYLEERDSKVLELYHDQGKNTRNIAKELRMSLDVRHSSILRRNQVNHKVIVENEH
jgi:DNA-directed RNA polymerase specialized sigma subunit